MKNLKKIVYGVIFIMTLQNLTIKPAAQISYARFEQIVKKIDVTVSSTERSKLLQNLPIYYDALSTADKLKADALLKQLGVSFAASKPYQQSALTANEQGQYQTSAANPYAQTRAQRILAAKSTSAAAPKLLAPSAATATASTGSASTAAAHVPRGRRAMKAPVAPIKEESEVQVTESATQQTAQPTLYSVAFEGIAGDVLYANVIKAARKAGYSFDRHNRFDVGEFVLVPRSGGELTVGQIVKENGVSVSASGEDSVIYMVRVEPGENEYGTKTSKVEFLGGFPRTGQSATAATGRKKVSGAKTQQPAKTEGETAPKLASRRLAPQQTAATATVNPPAKSKPSRRAVESCDTPATSAAEQMRALAPSRTGLVSRQAWADSSAGKSGTVVSAQSQMQRNLKSAESASGSAGKAVPPRRLKKQPQQPSAPAVLAQPSAAVSAEEHAQYEQFWAQQSQQAQPTLMAAASSISDDADVLSKLSEAYTINQAGIRRYDKDTYAKFIEALSAAVKSINSGQAYDKKAAKEIIDTTMRERLRQVGETSKINDEERMGDDEFYQLFTLYNWGKGLINPILSQFAALELISPDIVNQFKEYHTTIDEKLAHIDHVRRVGTVMRKNEQ